MLAWLKLITEILCVFITNCICVFNGFFSLFRHVITSECNESLDSLVEFIINISLVNQYSKNSPASTVKGNSVIINRKQQGVVLLKILTAGNVFSKLKLLVSFIAFGNSLIIITNKSDQIKKFYDFIGDNLPPNLVYIINYENVIVKNVSREVNPDLEVLAVKTFVSKTVFSEKL